ncbi:FkbM family methyltransferase [Paenibacillus barengoltzii]|uniref:FkbM family methyltransferase n=1 Tax=Paenibacillus barengoltzii TaxID=343517 RepID=UPI0013E00785|nr:FkbM family methyltransferase [Paenibacillus barengoltzii]
MITPNISSVTLLDGSTFWGIEKEYIYSNLKSNKEYYEKKDLDRFVKYIPNNSVIYDIGANIGNHTVFFKKYYKASKIFSFEPVPTNFELLKKNVFENSLSDIELFNVGVGETYKKSSVITNQTNMGECKLYDSPAGNIDVLPIDGQDFDVPDFVKIDVEGDELNVLKGMSNTLTKYNPVIWIEINNNFNEVDSFLSQLNYELIDKLNFNHIYVKTKNTDDRIATLENFKKNIIKESNQLLIDKWNLNKWLNSSKERVTRLEKEIADERAKLRQKEQYYMKSLETIASHPILLPFSKATERSFDNENSTVSLDIIAGLHEIHGNFQNLEKKIDALNKQLADQKVEIDKLVSEKYHLNNQILNHIQEQRNLLFEIKRIQDHYQIIERRYMRLKNSLIGKVGIKAWKLLKKFRKR